MIDGFPNQRMGLSDNRAPKRKCGKKIFDSLNLNQKILLGFSSFPPKFKNERFKTKFDEKEIPSEYNKVLKI